MRAVVMHELAQPVHVEDVDLPALPADGVIVQVRATGLCRSDWHAWAGHDDVALPHVPGHELAGVITQVGSDVTKWRIGQRVTVPFVEGCGSCDWCRNGDAQVCPQQEQPGFTHWGSFAEFVALRHADTNLIEIPEGVSFAAAASLGCRFATAYRALVHRVRIQAGEWLLVVGAGGVGLSCVAIATALGVKTLVVDRNPDALAVAVAHGATATLTSDEADEVRVHEVTDGGAHASVDAVGHEATCALSIFGLRRRGRQVQVGLLPPVDGFPKVPMHRVIGWELDVFGSHGMAARAYPELLQMVQAGTLAPQDLITSTISLEQAATALPRVDSHPSAGVTMIDPQL